MAATHKVKSGGAFTFSKTLLKPTGTHVAEGTEGTVGNQQITTSSGNRIVHLVQFTPAKTGKPELVPVEDLEPIGWTGE